jgi:hypothetical protein
MLLVLRIRYFIIMIIVLSDLIFTSNRISRLFLSGPAAGGIEKMRSIFFQKTKSSGVPVIPPSGGTGSEAKAMN